jgi:hypothetical protein
MLLPLTTEEYAQNLIQRYNAMRSLVSEEKLYQIFLGAKDSVKFYPEDIRRAYDLAEKELFPQTPVPPSEPTPNRDQRPTQEQAPKPVGAEPTPTLGDLFRAWQQGGKEKLAQMLPDIPDEEE